MRQLRITHTYIVEVPDEVAEDPVFDSIANAGVSMMEAHMRGLMPKIKDLRSDWTTIPTGGSNG